MNKYSQKGFSMVELMITLIASLIVTACLLSLLGSNSGAARANADAQELETRADEALAAISAAVAGVPDGGTFSVTGEGNFNAITAPCTTAYCDYVSFPDAPENERTSIAKGLISPAGRDVIYVRRWRIDTTNTDYQLRRIVVAIFKTADDTKPLFVQQTTIGARSSF